MAAINAPARSTPLFTRYKAVMVPIQLGHECVYGALVRWLRWVQKNCPQINTETITTARHPRLQRTNRGCRRAYKTRGGWKRRAAISLPPYPSFQPCSNRICRSRCRQVRGRGSSVPGIREHGDGAHTTTEAGSPSHTKRRTRQPLQIQRTHLVGPRSRRHPCRATCTARAGEKEIDKERRSGMHTHRTGCQHPHCTHRNTRFAMSMIDGGVRNSSRNSRRNPLTSMTRWNALARGDRGDRGLVGAIMPLPGRRRSGNKDRALPHARSNTVKSMASTIVDCHRNRGHDGTCARVVHITRCHSEVHR